MRELSDKIGSRVIPEVPYRGLITGSKWTKPLDCQRGAIVRNRDDKLSLDLI